MSSIDPNYESVVNFFNSKNDENVPDPIKGIWSLNELDNMSILMSFNNSMINGTTITNKLYQPGNWLFRESNFFTKYLSKIIKYSYQFNFNSTFTFAQIYIKLGCIPLYFPKWLTNWTVEVKSDKIIRKTSFLGWSHEYTLTKINNDNELKNIGKFNKFYY